MGYVWPTFEELPLPTLEEFRKNPDYYLEKLRKYQETPYSFKHFGLEWLFRLLRK